MNPKPIRSWTAMASLNEDTGVIAFQFQDATATPYSLPLPSARLAAAIAVLESSQAAWLIETAPGQFVVSNALNPPGPRPSGTL